MDLKCRSRATKRIETMIIVTPYQVQLSTVKSAMATVSGGRIAGSREERRQGSLVVLDDALGVTDSFTLASTYRKAAAVKVDEGHGWRRLTRM